MARWVPKAGKVLKPGSLSANQPGPNPPSLTLRVRRRRGRSKRRRLTWAQAPLTPPLLRHPPPPAFHVALARSCHIARCGSGGFPEHARFCESWSLEDDGRGQGAASAAAAAGWMAAAHRHRAPDAARRPSWRAGADERRERAGVAARWEGPSRIRRKHARERLRAARGTRLRGIRMRTKISSSAFRPTATTAPAHTHRAPSRRRPARRVFPCIAEDAVQRGVRGLGSTGMPAAAAAAT
eukprot:363781-Chlamydomonas_euryale.AAC.3